MTMRPRRHRLAFAFPMLSDRYDIEARSKFKPAGITDCVGVRNRGSAASWVSREMRG